MLKDCQAGGRFTGTVLVTEWKESPFRSKAGSFITMMCQDCSAILPAKIWETEACHYNWLQESDVFQVEAVVSEFRGALELTIEMLRPVAAPEIDFTQLLPSSPIPEEVLEQRLQDLRNSLENESLRCLLDRILDHPSISVLYRQAPAALKIHQPYLQGLWEHSLWVWQNWPEALPLITPK